MAGTQFRGQFEQRMKGLIDEVKKLGNIILMIDEIHNIVGAGDAEGSMNAANILKPALSRGEIQVIGATTFNEYRKSIEKDSALERRFQPVTVNEPSIEDSIKILKGLAPNYEAYHGVKISDGILRQAVLLSERYITDRFLPDKAIDLIDEACSDLNLKDPDISRRMQLQREIDDFEKERTMLEEQGAQEGAEPDYEQIATLKSKILQRQHGAEHPAFEGRSPAHHGESGPCYRAVDQDPGLQDPGGGIPAAQPAGGAAQESHRRTGRSHRGGGRRRAAEPGGHLPQAQARQLHFRRLHRRGQDGAGEAAGRGPVQHPGRADPSGYVGIYGKALRFPDRRLPAGLCGL